MFLWLIRGICKSKKRDVNNVDLNRNFDYNWKAGKGQIQINLTSKAKVLF